MSARAMHEARFGSPIFRETPSALESTLETPRARASKRPGVSSFTDPLNPSGRIYCKNVAASGHLQEAKADGTRAGARTRNPGVQRADLGSERLSAKEARERCLPHRYGNQDWRPSKASPTCAVSGQRSPRGLNSEGVGELLGSAVGGSGWTPVAQKEQQQARASGSTALGNYLNDMKRSVCARRPVAGDPSGFLRRMNDVRTQLPAQMTLERRSASCDLGCMRRTAHLESEPDEATHFGFPRKKPVEGRGSSRGPQPHFLAHAEPALQPATPRSPQRLKATQRFEEVVSHMKASSPAVREQLLALKAKNKTTHGMLYSESVVLYEV